MIGKHRCVWGVVGFTHPTIGKHRCVWGVVGFTHPTVMSEYRRCMVAGGTYFFTVVGFQRRWIFEDEQNVRLLGDSMRHVRKEAPFRTVAVVVLPDHLHCIWSLPRLDADYSTRWKQIKREFTVRFLGAGGEDLRVSDARRSRGERGVWQHRYWEHVVEDEKELEGLCDYIHYNPVKHGFAASPAEWRWSTFARFIASGQYDPDWGRTAPDSINSVLSIVGE